MISTAYQTTGNDYQGENLIGKLNSLAEEYKERQRRMDDRLRQEIENHQIAHGKSKDKYASLNDGSKVKIKVQSSPLQNNQTYINQEKPQQFYRSQRAVAMRITDSYETQVSKLESEKLSLIQKLNDALVNLDKLNQEKVQKNNELIEIMKFIRDLERETTKGEDLSAVVNDELRIELRSEKELSHQLKEQLKSAEMERVRILTKIHELSQVYESGEVMHSDLNVNYTYKTRTYAQLEQEYREIIEMIRKTEDEIDSLKAQIIANEEQIARLRDSIDELVGERRVTQDRIRNLQDKLDTAVRNYEIERHDIDNMQKRHLKLLSSNILFQSLSDIHQQNMLFNFQSLRFITQAKTSTIKGLKQLRKLFKHNKQERLKKYLNLWFRLALKPMKNKNQKYLLSLAMQAKNPMSYAFYKWQIQLERNVARKHVQRQVIQNMLISKDRYHSRVARHFFIRWRDQIRLTEQDKKRIINKWIWRKHRDSIKVYFARWKEISIEVENQLVLNGMAQRLAFKKYLGQLFNQWRQVSTDLKNKRLANLNRIWKNLKTNVMIKKQMQRQTWSILREEKIRNQNLIKACFDAMRQQKEEQKFEKITNQLYEAEIPRREQALELIEKVEKIDNYKYKKVSMQVICKHLNKRLFSYLFKWKQETDNKRQFILSNLKQKTLQVYLTILRQAFTKWVAQKGRIMIQMQTDTIQEFQSEIQDLTNQIVEEKQTLKDREIRKQCQSGRQIKKILQNLMQRQLRSKFMIWKMNHQQVIREVVSIDKIISRRDKRIKRLAFQRYAQNIRELREEANNVKRAEDIRLKLREKEKRRIFNAIRQFSQNHLNARKYMHRLIIRLDISLKETTFKNWVRFSQYETENLLQENQNHRVQEIKHMKDEIGHYADKLEEINQQNKKLQRSVDNNARRQIKLAFQRYLQNTTEQAFEKWKKQVYHEKKKERIMRSAIVHMLRHTQDEAFKLWRSKVQKQTAFKFETLISQEEKVIENIEQQKKQSNKIYAMNREDKETNLNKVEEEKTYLMRKHQNCLQAMIKKVDEQDHILFQRHIISEWHQFTQRRKRCIDILQNAIKKTLWQQGLNEIKQYSKQQLIKDKSESRLEKLTKAVEKIKLRVAFRQWNSGCKDRVLTCKMITQKEIDLTKKQHEKLVNLVQSRIEEQLIQHRQYLKTFDCYVAWKSFVQSEKSLKTKIESYQKELEDRNKIKCISKWLSRKRATDKFRHIKNKLDKVYNQSLLRSCFQAIKYDNHIARNLCSGLSHLANSVNIVFLQRSFKAIHTHSASESFIRLRNKLKSAEKISSCLTLKYQNQMRNVLNEMRIENVKRASIDSGIKATIKFYYISKLRGYFKEWKDEAQRRTVIQQNTEDGKIAVENHNLRKQMVNLVNLLEQEGIDPSKIKRIVEKNREQSLRLLEKSVCRLLCYKDKELYLMPLCIDRWKMWLKHRKMFKYWLGFLNKRVDERTADVFYAFRKWKNQDKARAKELMLLKKKDLEKIYVNNQYKLNQINNDLLKGEEVASDLTDQRDILLRRYVGAQRLALAASNASCDKAKQKTISRLISAVADSNSAVFEEALQLNLEKIQELKSKIKYLEKSNHALSEQNEELRTNALDGIEMAKSVDVLTREREKLGINLADKAIIIRKLLEDNNNLTIRLSNAQEEAQKLIRISQMRLDQSNGSESLY